MDSEDPEELFGDDDFGDIPDATLRNLETQARQSTQQAPGTEQTEAQVRSGAGKTTLTNGRPAPSSDYGFDADEDVIDLDAQPSFVQQQPPAKPVQPRRPDEVTQREQWRHQRYAQTTPAYRNPMRRDREQTPRQGQDVGTKSSVSQRVAAPSTQEQVRGSVEEPEIVTADIDVRALQAKIQDLEQQAQALQKAADDARNMSYAKSGEVAIVRANQQKEAQDFEKKLRGIQQQHSEDIARSKAELDAVRKEREKFQTNNRFLEHDLAREAERTRNARRTLKDTHGNTNREKPSPLSTPRKNKMIPLRDGFDDSEVVVSPSKARYSSKAPSTPKAGTKRKRPNQEEHAPSSPLPSFTKAEPMGQGHSNVPTPKQSLVAIASHTPETRKDEKFEFMQTILDHRTPDGRDRTLEALTKFYLPSTPTTSFASTIYDRLTFFALQQELDQFRLQVCDVLLSQWKRSLHEKYYDPLYDLTELLLYILVISPPPLSASLILRITPLCQSTIDLITIATAKAFIDPSKNALPTRTLKSKIDPLHYVKILNFISSYSALTDMRPTSNSSLINFWSHIEFDFILTILHRAQPMKYITAMLDLLHSSILPSCFGSIYPELSRQQQMESNLIDRLTKLLSEDPQHPRPTPRETHFSDFLAKNQIEEEELERGALPLPEPYTTLELLELRTEVLGLLYQIALSEHGGQLLATHKTAIFRLVRRLHESVVKLYTTYNSLTDSDTPPTDDDDDDDAETKLSGLQLDEEDDEVNDVNKDTTTQTKAYKIHAYHINTTTTILYHLNSTHGSLSLSSSSSQPSQSTAPPNNPPPSKNITTPLLNIHATLQQHSSSAQAYLVALSRIAFCEESGLEAGISAEASEMAHEMLDEFVSPEDGEGVLGVFESGRVSSGV